MPISKKQQMILAFPYTKYQALICDGAVRSGKTSIMAVAFVDWAMDTFTGTNFGICGKTVSSAVKNIIVPFMSLSRTKKQYSVTFTRGENRMIVQRGERKNTFYVYGGKDESSYMLIQGITLAGVLLDEVAMMTRSFVEQALARCLSFPNRRYWFNCNPEGPQHWFRQEWVLQPEKHNALHLHFLMSDNPALDEQTLVEAAAMYSGVFYDRYILGQWKQAEGAIYRLFTECEQEFYIDALPHLQHIQIGLDFGGNKSKHAFCASAITRNFGELIVLCAEEHPAQGINPQELYDLFVDFYQRVRRQYGRIDAVYADSAEQTLINGLRGALPEADIRNSIKNEIVDRIRATTSLMAQRRFKLVRGQCDTLSEAFKSAAYDDKKQEDVRLDNGSYSVDQLDSFEYSWENYIELMTRG